MKDQNEQLRSAPGETSDMRNNQQSLSEISDLHSLKIDTHEFQEGIEGLVGREISEVGGEDRSGLGDYSAGGGKNASKIQDVKAHLMANMPPVKVMIKEVRKKLQEELHEVVKLSREAEIRRDYHKLTILFARIRQLTERIEEIKNASLDYIKKMWLKLVHGIISG